jgi:hypothetical protein
MQPEMTPKHSSAAGFRHWQSLSDGFLLSIVVVGPTFLFEELWRGKPMIDQSGNLWILPAVMMAIGFFAGGSVAGRNRSTMGGSLFQGIVVAALTLGVVFIVDMVRRLVLSQGISSGVLTLWLGCAAGALLVGGLGGISGRRGTRLAQRRYQMDRFQ